MKIIAGLGTPGEEYDNTRHNLGFMIADAIKHCNPSFGEWRGRHDAMVSEGTLENNKIILMKPLTGINESGGPVSSLMRFYKEASTSLVVIHDDMDIPAGQLRWKLGGGHGGHNGVRNIIDHMDPQFYRLRVGIGRPPDSVDVLDYVVGSLRNSPWVDTVIETVAKKANMLINGQARFIMGEPNPRTPEAADVAR